MTPGRQADSLPADELVSELSIAARAIGIDEAALAAALGNGQTLAQVAQVNGVKQRRVVRALVSSVVASVADDIRRGELNPDQVTWLVALATRYAEQQVRSVFPAMEFRPGSAPGGLARGPVRPRGRAVRPPARNRSGNGTGPAAGTAPSAGAAPAAAAV